MGKKDPKKKNKKKEKKQNSFFKDKPSSQWKVSHPVGGTFLTIDPLFTDDEQ